MRYEKISPTAETIALIRSGLGIPYSGDIACLCSAQKATLDFYHRPDFNIDFCQQYKRTVKKLWWSMDHDRYRFEVAFRISF